MEEEILSSCGAVGGGGGVLFFSRDAPNCCLGGRAPVRICALTIETQRLHSEYAAIVPFDTTHIPVHYKNKMERR